MQMNCGAPRHAPAGKDRTGLVCMLLLLLCGVDPPQVRGCAGPAVHELCMCMCCACPAHHPGPPLRQGFQALVAAC